VAELRRQGVARGRRELRRWSREGRLVQARNRLRVAARELVDAMVAGHEGRVRGLLAPDVTVVDAGSTSAGRDAAHRHLMAAITGMHESSLDVDAQAAVVRWTAADGGIQMHRLEADRAGQIRRVQIDAVRSAVSR
jgi:hypothetical protein